MKVNGQNRLDKTHDSLLIQWIINLIKPLKENFFLVLLLIVCIYLAVTGNWMGLIASILAYLAGFLMYRLK